MKRRYYHLKVMQKRSLLSFIKQLVTVNKAMKHKLESGQCIDVSKCKRTTAGDYTLHEFIPDMDYCDARRKVWIWTISKAKPQARSLPPLLPVIISIPTTSVFF